jgi:cytochrome c oxidase subunit III
MAESRGASGVFDATSAHTAPGGPRPTADAPPATAHQFDDLEQQHEADTLGMWTFLATEVLFFGGLFAASVVYRGLYPAAWAEASHHTQFWLGTINTAVLLCSSLSMALSVDAAQAGRSRAVALLLALTALLGTAFLGVKAYEYYLEYADRLVPGLNFAFEGANAGPVRLFFTLYFIMTGLHAVHLTIGIAIMAVLAVLAWRGRFGDGRYMPVEIAGLYWHFIDVVWVFLYPLIYLVGHRR